MKVRKARFADPMFPTDYETAAVFMASMAGPGILFFTVHLVERDGDGVIVYFTTSEDAGGTIGALPVYEGEEVVDITINNGGVDVTAHRAAVHNIKVAEVPDGHELYSVEGYLVSPVYPLDEVASSCGKTLPAEFLTTLEGNIPPTVLRLVGIKLMKEDVGSAQFNWIVAVPKGVLGGRVWITPGMRSTDNRTMKGSGGFMLKRASENTMDEWK